MTNQRGPDDRDRSGYPQGHPHRAAVAGATGQLASELTVAARKPGFAELLAWGRGLAEERVWAIEDCRHVSGGLERFLVAAGERVVRVPPKLMGQSRRGERSARQVGPDRCPRGRQSRSARGPRDPAGCAPRRGRVGAEAPARPSRGHRQVPLRRPAAAALAPARPRPELELPAGCLDRPSWLDRLARRLARAEQSARGGSRASWWSRSAVACAGPKSSKARSRLWSPCGRPSCWSSKAAAR